MKSTAIARTPGTRDFYPAEMRQRTWLFDQMRAVSARFGYEEYDGPILEPYELYAAKSGDALVGDEMYTLTDRGGRRLGVRPEMTPTLARMVAQRQSALRKPIKWFSIPSCWRYERMQKGRLREHFQWNVDVLGVEGPEAEAEVIAVVVTLLRELGLTTRDIRVRIGNRAWLAVALTELSISESAQLWVLRIIDGREKVTPAAFSAELAEAGLTPAQVAGLIARLDARDYTGCAPLCELMDLLTAYGLAEFCEFDPTIVRGLAYYTGTVYEVWDQRREFRAIAGGGRYDDLTVALGGARLPGAGIAMGDVVLSLLLAREGKLPTLAPALDAFVACYSADERDAGIRLAQSLRAAGLRVDRALQPASLREQLRRAEALGARTAVLLVPDELARGAAILRDLRAGTQTVVALENVADTIAPSTSTKRQVWYSPH
jgi:histidyl-tRNA synthetase